MGKPLVRSPIGISASFRFSRPNNSFAERVVKTLRSEILDWTLIHGRRHFDQVLRTYASHYNAERPHRGLELAVPENPSPVAPVDEVPEIGRRDLIGGLIREYHAVAS
jgi:transposase InsO family protein